MTTFVLIAQIILAVLLVVLVVLQTQSSGAGSMFGSDTSVYRTRRGLEKTLYQATIGVSIVFIVISIFSVLVAG
ncbi:MAG: preprotein translocase subunit SecG [Caldilineales bacterium]|nr:preprotein translocase subunit SecG [Caldilineales bacterium]MCW5860192.1 preprotein translocase subunit SecG [Caldilineales bacterium]